SSPWELPHHGGLQLGQIQGDPVKDAAVLREGAGATGEPKEKKQHGGHKSTHVSVTRLFQPWTCSSFLRHLRERRRERRVCSKCEGEAGSTERAREGEAARAALGDARHRHSREV
ncbi:leishmanolysin, partial [Trypanosoma cruzi]